MGKESHGSEHIVELVRENIAQKSDVIKLMMASATRPVDLDAAELTAAIGEAHRNNIPVAVHANFSRDSISAAVAAHCDSLEHGFILDEPIISDMLTHDVALCPTILALRAVSEHAQAWSARGGADVVAAAQRSRHDAERSFTAALTAGVRIIAGTDAGVTRVGFDALPKELECMVEWGMSPARAIRSATLDAAMVLRRTELGVIEAGSAADLVLLAANPLQDITALRMIEGIVQDGRVISIPDQARSGRSASGGLQT
jgi:imidazolonepropionase-like amidohydrolase